MIKTLLLFLALAGPKQPANQGHSMLKQEYIMYQMGMVVDLKVMKYHDVIFTYVRFVPYGYSNPTDRGFAFCDNRITAFLGKGDFVVLTYDPTAHST